MSNIVYVLNHMFISACMCKCRAELHAPRNARSSSFADSSPLYLFFVVVFTVDLPLNYSPFVYALSTIIFKVKLSGYKSSNCVTESMRTITITDLTTSCIKLLPTIIYNASTAHLHTGEITGLFRSHSPSINASHTVVVAEDPQPND